MLNLERLHTFGIFWIYHRDMTLTNFIERVHLTQGWVLAAYLHSWSHLRWIEGEHRREEYHRSAN